MLGIHIGQNSPHNILFIISDSIKKAILSEKKIFFTICQDGFHICRIFSVKKLLKGGRIIIYGLPGANDSAKTVIPKQKAMTL